MITNERQYRITKAQADKFADALISVMESQPDDKIHPSLRKAEIDALESQLADLRQQIQEYEQLKSGMPVRFTTESVSEIAKGLIKARVVAGLSQKELADKLGIKEQQIQRYEISEYSGAKLSRIVEVLDALGVGITLRMKIPGRRNEELSHTEIPSVASDS